RRFVSSVSGFSAMAGSLQRLPPRNGRRRWAPRQVPRCYDTYFPRATAQDSLPFEESVAAPKSQRDCVGLALRACGRRVRCQIPRRRDQNMRGLRRAVQQCILLASRLEHLDGVEVTIFAQERRSEGGQQVLVLAAIGQVARHQLRRLVYLL